MRRILHQHAQFAGLTAGILGALVLLTLTSHPAAAKKADPDPDTCGQGLGSLCRNVETCTPKGFEDNGTCKWTYTSTKTYWRG
jgi:hypothetical protein